ncbi:MAG: hypothetical protein ACAI44_24800 [Candidatus Sericytochromatia bacterium]
MQLNSYYQGGSSTPSSNPLANSTYSQGLIRDLGQRQYQLNPDDLAQQAAVSRAKRLQSLLGQLSDLLEKAVTSSPDPDAAVQDYDRYVEYILARVAGDPNAQPPQGFEEFAAELESLVDDVVAAFEALLNSGDFAQDQDPEQLSKSLNGIMAMLERIAARRIERMLANDWYLKWRQMYRNDLSEITECHFVKDQTTARSLPEGVSQADADSAEGLQRGPSSVHGSQLLELLSQASEMKGPNQQPLLNEGLLQGVKHLLATFQNAK